MFFKDIQVAFQKLTAFEGTQSADKLFIEQINRKFYGRSDDALITSDDIVFIKDIFQQRWINIRDTHLDYTWSQSGINQLWIDLARSISANDRTFTTIQYLFSTLKNDRDPFSLLKRTDCPDYAQLYLGADESLYEIVGLIKHLEHYNYRLSTYHSSSLSRLQPLRLSELSRFRSRTHTQTPFLVANVRYENFWEFLIRKVFPNLQKEGELPVHMMGSFINLIETYFEEKEEGNSYDSFKLKFGQWLNLLYECPIEQLNQFYGIILTADGKKTYLLELLIIMQQAEDYSLDSIFLLIAQWLAEFNPAYVLDHHAVRGVYEALQCGPSLTLNSVVDNLKLLDCDGNLELQAQIDHLLELCAQSKDITPFFIDQLSVLYQSRWEFVKDKSLDYTRLQTGINANWIKLVQYLAGAKKIPPNYYQWLMPTLEYSFDTATTAPITDFPLSHFVLSRDSRYLILLDSCVKQHKVNGSFCYWLEDKPVNLSPVEVDRIQYAAPFFLNYYQMALQKIEFIPVSMKTIEALKALVDGSVFESGLYYHPDRDGYNKSEMTQADQAYFNFATYLHDLDPQERAALNQQFTLYYGVKYTFQEILSRVNEHECITLIGKFYIQLLVNYAPFLKFSSEIESKFNVEQMRRNSTHLVVSDYNFLSQTEARRRCLSIFVSLLTTSFQSIPILFGHSIEFWDRSNKLTSSAKQIYVLLLQMIKSRSFSDSRFVYAYIMEGIVKPELQKKSVFFFPHRFENFCYDLSQNKNTGFPYNFYAVNDILQSLFSALKVDLIPKNKLQEVIDDILRTLGQKSHEDDIAIRVNVVFVLFLKTLDAGVSQFILEDLTNPQQDFDHSLFVSSCLEYVNVRLGLKLSASGILSHSSNVYEPKEQNKDQECIAFLKRLVVQISSIYSAIESISSEQKSFLSMLTSPIQSKSDIVNDPVGELEESQAPELGAP